MATYRYEAMNAQGQAVKQEIDANSEEEAIQKIRAMKLFPTSIKEKAGAAKRGTTAAGGQKKGKKSLAIGGVSNKALTLFTRQLSTLQDAGLPIVRSLKILEGQQKPGALKNILVEVTEDVEGGMTFSEALSKHPRAFDKLYVNMVRAGEIGGVLDAILQRLADFREKAQRLKKQIIGAMIYPAAVVTVAGGILAGILTFIVPKFKKMFDELNVELPFLTQVLIAFSDFVANKWYWGLAIIFGTIIVMKTLAATSGGKYILDRVKLKLPVFGTIISKATIARFTRTLGTLVASGVPILEALNITKDTAGNQVIANAIARVHDSIREGESIAEPLAQSKICDDMVVNMIDVGEETGDLDKMLLKIADQYDEDVDVAVAGMTSLIEPIMIIFLGGAVGFIVIALFLPLIKLMNSLGG
jgi:type IV pilus assembly protein PilC